MEEKVEIVSGYKNNLSEHLTTLKNPSEWFMWYVNDTRWTLQEGVDISSHPDYPDQFPCSAVSFPGPGGHSRLYYFYPEDAFNVDTELNPGFNAFTYDEWINKDIGIKLHLAKDITVTKMALVYELYLFLMWLIRYKVVGFIDTHFNIGTITRARDIATLYMGEGRPTEADPSHDDGWGWSTSPEPEPVDTAKNEALVTELVKSSVIAGLRMSKRIVRRFIEAIGSSNSDIDENALYEMYEDVLNKKITRVSNSSVDTGTVIRGITIPGSGTNDHSKD